MIQLCSVCHKLLKDGDKAKVWVTATYHTLKSTVAYALDRYDLEADPKTLRHADCNAKEAPQGD